MLGKKKSHAKGESMYPRQLIMHIWLANHPPVSIWPERGERGREKGEACGRFTHSIPLEKIQSTVTPCSMSLKGSVYTETKTDSHTTVHTKTHTPTFMEACTQSIIVPDSGSSDLSLSALRRVHATCSCQKSLYFQLTIHLFLITDLFFLSCWVKRGWAYLGLAKLKGSYLAWPAGELRITRSDLGD